MLFFSKPFIHCYVGGAHSLNCKIIFPVEASILYLPSCLQHVVVICKFIVAWFVPDNPLRVKNERLEDKLRRLKKELW